MHTNLSWRVDIAHEISENIVRFSTVLFFKFVIEVWVCYCSNIIILFIALTPDKLTLRMEMSESILHFVTVIIYYLLLIYDILLLFVLLLLSHDLTLIIWEFVIEVWVCYSSNRTTSFISLYSDELILHMKFWKASILSKAQFL